jgi:phasin family protein
MAAQKNPFLDLDVSKFMDASKMLSDFKFPGVDLEKVVAVQRKNVEALTSANQTALEGIQAIAKRQSEILRSMIEESNSVLKAMMEQGSPEEKMTKQADLLKTSFEKTLGHMRELSEMVAKSNREAFDVINSRVTESLEEMKSLMPAAAPAKKSTKA